MTRAEHPLIAVNGLLEGDKPSLRLDNRYADAVLKAGGVPLAIPPIGGPADIERLLDRVDGLLLTGGDDFDTERIGLGPTHPKADPVPTVKQDFDWVLCQKALERNLPTLGICYGMQLMGLLDGASFHQHLPEDRPGGAEHAGGIEHTVRIEPGSKLARLMGVEEITVVSRHHQALASAPVPWTVCAVDGEGLIEAIERPDKAFAVGVQWHPELSPEGSGHDRLIRGFVGAAGMAAAREFQRTS